MTANHGLEQTPNRSGLDTNIAAALPRHAVSTQYQTRPLPSQLIDFGDDGIITDRPDILRGILVTRGLNLPNGFEIQQDLFRTDSKNN
jgi:hypothetical protein